MVDRTVDVRLRAHIANYVSGMRTAATQTAAMGTQVSRTMQANQAAFTAGGTAAIGFGAAVALGLGRAVSSGSQFQAEMQNVKAVSQATGSQFEALRDQARDLGTTTKFTATEAAGGLSFLSMAGFEATESIEALPGVLDLAAAGNMELARTADISSNVLQGFNLQASEMDRVVDTMAATFTSANTDVQQLGDAMSYVAPVASAAGIELEETSAAIGLMSDAGIQGTRAGTSLRMAISRLLDETGPAADVLDRLGVSAFDSSGELRDLDDIVGQIEESGANASDVMELFGLRAGPAMQTLVDRGAESLSRFTGELEQSGGTAKRVADTQMEGLQGAVTELGSAFEGLQIKIAESGLLGSMETFADTTTATIRAVEGLPDPVVAAGAQMATAASAVSLFGGAALIAGPRVAALTTRLGGLRSASAKFGALTLLTTSVFELTEGFQRGRMEADEMMREIIEGSETADEAIGKLDKSLREHLESMGEVDAGNIGNAFLGFVGAARNAGDSIAELTKAWDAWRGESEIAEAFAKDHGAALAVQRGEVESLTGAVLGLDEATAQQGPTLERAEALDDMGESARNASRGLGRTTESLELLSGIGESAFQSLSSGFDVFETYTTLTAEAAEQTETATEDMDASWARFQESQEQTLEDQRNWMANLQNLRSRGFDELAADLAARGPEQAGLVAQAAEQSNAELAKGEARARAIRRQNAEMALSELQSQLGNMVDASGRLSNEAATTIAEELGVTPGNVRAILANTKTVADGQLDAIETAFGSGAAEAARAAVDNLNLGGQAQSNIVSQYATQLAEGLNPVIEQVNGNPIVVPGKADWRNVPYAAGTAMAAGGITSEPRVLYGEGPGDEAFIPLYEGMGATHARSVGLWEDTGRRLGVYPDTRMAAGGFTGTDDVPDVPGLSGLGGHYRESARSSMEHTREAALAWLEENLAPELGAGIGYQAMFAALQAQFPGVDLISGFRPGSITSTGNLSYHAMGRAVDFDPSAEMARWVNDNYFAQTRELITPWQSLNIRNGSRFSYSDGVMELHDGRVGVRHNHWAMAGGGILGGDGASLLPSFEHGGVTARDGIGQLHGGERVFSQPDNRDLIDAIERMAANGDTPTIVVNYPRGEPTERGVTRAMRREQAMRT